MSRYETRVVRKFLVLKWRWTEFLQEFRPSYCDNYGMEEWDWQDVRELSPLEKALM